MIRLKLTISYDGLPWKGWQSQAGGKTIQDQVEAAMVKIVGQRVVVHGSGRTDTGVHARAQVAHIEVENESWAGGTWIRALNATLPQTIRVLKCEPAEPRFHARFDATGKVYEYRIWNTSIMSPFEIGRAWHVWDSLDKEALREGARLLCGKHNYSRLSANRGHTSDEERRSDLDSVIRTVRRIEFFEEGEVLRFELEGDGFLYKMVRLIVGSLIQMAKGRETLDWVRSLVEEPGGLKSNYCAPADGLYLVKVMYD
jgi:tRNA pseudouridine38-40 synthase